MSGSDPELTLDSGGEGAYEHFRRGSSLLASRDFAAAAVSLERARALEPEKASIREALGRAYFQTGRFAAAAEEFAAIVERHPVDDFALFCLGRSLQMSGRPHEARPHIALAACLRPERADYRVYRDKLRAAQGSPAAM